MYHDEMSEKRRSVQFGGKTASKEFTMMQRACTMQQIWCTASKVIAGFSSETITETRLALFANTEGSQTRRVQSVTCKPAARKLGARREIMWIEDASL